MAAKVNLRTGKIIGAEENSFAWHHEQGHMIYDDSELGIRNTYLQEMWLYSAITLGIISIPFRIVWFLSLASILGFWYYFFYEERWCDNYAKTKLKEDKNVQEKSTA